MFRRAYTTVQPRARPTWRDSLSPSVFKSLFLTLVFGSVVVEATRGRKELEALKGAYEAKFRILEDVTGKVRRREPVDVAQELKIANAITRHKYNSVTDVEMDEQFEEILRMADEPVEESTGEKKEGQEIPSEGVAEKPQSAKFL
ncbi:uncharacterized protein CXQ87_001740 [Candidozyma duobushaemuli]|uniref:Uncharacterized protein n=2 Tax=Candidozyma TaxID=3303203 RepID=A0ABX8I6N4_9ASCO|nr:uncharacterized protein CXQ87_001740 [[Candida] duobushaemulonis]PVH13631.1 hypothetical protein CXQ87_001740 [[Candida] duobushaemulonis]QWU88134.1 hypothetical protein CA3LBN_002399 [[Candida] haemuloni]